LAFKRHDARSLKSGKEATVYTVGTGTQVRCAVPKPYGYFNDTLVMELVTDAAGDPAPRLGEVELTPGVAREYHAFLIRQVVCMLSIGLAAPGGGGWAGDHRSAASANAARNNQAFAILERDVNNLRGTLGRVAPELLEKECAREIWALFGWGI